MATQRKLERHQIEDLEVIRELGPETLRAIVDRLGELDPAPLRPEKLFDTVVEVLADRKDAADSVVRQALSLHGLVRQGRRSVPDVLEGIRSGIDADSGWTNEQKEKWQAVAPQFHELVASRAVRLVTTAIDLSYEYANLLQRTRILTDIRPLYNNDATEIEGAVVSHTLRLRYSRIDGNHQLSIAMDELDVRELAKECDRALRKATTARDLMKDKVDVPTIISGEPDDA